MPVTTIAAGRAFTYVSNIGKISRSALGFRHPIGLARGADDVLYVGNWGDEPQPNCRITKCVVGTQDWIMDIGQAGSGEGQFLWPGGLAADKNEVLYVTDQANNKVVGYSKDGKYVTQWGKGGSGDGQFSGPSGIAIDKNDNFWVVDTRNHRVQKFNKSGKFLSKFGVHGNLNGQLNMPWGIALDKDTNVYVADWGNSRVQKFSSEGRYLMTFGKPGKGKGEIDHPSAVFVDQDGDVYVAGWGNNRVVIFEADGTYLTTLLGDANTLSVWAKMGVDANPDLKKALERANLEPMWRLWRPAAILVDDEHRVFIAEAQHMRVQIYKKDPKHQEAQFTL